MLTSRKMTLKPLFESADGVHFTAYLVNRGKLSDLRTQLSEAIEHAHEFINPVMSVEERDSFFEPLRLLLADARIFRQMKGNIGIFRNRDSFRVLNVPVAVQTTCQVATSFHVKPLLRWLQADEEFLLLGIEEESAQLYVGSQESFKLVDTILFPDSFRAQDSNGDYQSLKRAMRKRQREDETFGWLNEWISELTRRTKPKLFLAGEKSRVESVGRILRYENLVKTPVSDVFGKEKVTEACWAIRKVLRTEANASIEKALMEFRFAEEGNRTRKNIFQISKAVVRGRVRKLIVSDELSIFGKIDRETGGLAIHPVDLDHEDDDILDDLAQMVLSQGGEVIVASKSEIPKGRPILAILDDDGEELQKTESSYRHETFRETIG